MGINGLWPVLEPTGQPVTLESLEAKRLAIDVSIWLYQAAKGYGAGSAFTASRNPHLALLLTRILKLLFYRIRPVFVFDGHNVPVFKKRLLEERNIKRHIDSKQLTKAQRRSLEMAAADSASSIAPSKINSRSAANEDDIFHLPLGTELSPDEDDDDIDFNLSGDLDIDALKAIPCDRRAELLLDAQQKTKDSRLKYENLPSDSMQFSRFQLGRLLRRKQVTEQLDIANKQLLGVWNETDSQKPSKMIVRQGLKRSHILQLDDVQTTDDAKSDENIKAKRCYVGDDVNFELQLAIEKSIKPDELSHSTDSLASYEPDCSIMPGHEKSDQDDDYSSHGYASDWSDDEFVDVPSTSTAAMKSTANKEEEAKVGDDWNPLIAEDMCNSGTEVSNRRNIELNDDANFDPNLNDGIYADCQVLLGLLGIPYVRAPGEAEAQCSHLESLNLVQATVSDDSDVWVFGSNTVYRHLFNQQKHVKCYTARQIQEALGISRIEIALLAMLAGGDYTSGIEGVGVVTALELIAEFSTDQGCTDDGETRAIALLESISQWYKTTNVNESAMRRRLRRVIGKVPDDFPNIEIFRAYMNPVVDKSAERFSWGVIDRDALSRFVWDKLGWDETKWRTTSDQPLHRWTSFLNGDDMLQSRITSFTVSMSVLEKDGDDMRLQSTTRVNKAIKKLMAVSKPPIEEKSGRCLRPRLRKPPKPTTTKKASKKKVSVTKKKREATLQLSEESSESGE